jgi:type IV secretion system protein VirD4
MRVNYTRFLLRFVMALCVCFAVTYLLMQGLWMMAGAVLMAGFWYIYLFKDTVAERRYDAHFATPQELDPLKNDPLAGDGVMVGFGYKDLLAVRPGMSGKKELGHFMWVGPNRSGKGLSITSNLTTWQGSAVIVDIKGEIAEATAGYRRDVLGQKVIILNPSDGERSHQYDPFAELETDNQMFSAAVAFMNPNQDGENAIFAQRASAVLAAIIRAAKVNGWPVIPTLDALLYHPEGVKGATLSLQALGDPAISKWLNAFLSKDPDKMDWEAAAGDRFLGNSWQRLVTAAQYLTTEGVMHMTGGSDFVASDLMDGPVTVYLVFREAELDLTLPLFNLVVDAMMRAMMRKYDMNREHYGSKGVKTLAVFDEAFRATPNMLPEYSSTVSGRGISMCIYVQSIAQLTDVWGKAGKTTVLDNVHTKIFLSAVDRNEGDKESTSAFVSNSCGSYMVEDRSINKQEHGHELSSGVRLTQRELITAAEFGQLPSTHSIVLTNELPPILAHRLEPWRFKAFKLSESLPIPELPYKTEVGRTEIVLPKPKQPTPAKPTAKPAPKPKRNNSEQGDDENPEVVAF